MASAELTGAGPGRRTPNQSPSAAREQDPDRRPEVSLELGFDGESLFSVRSSVAAHVAAVTGRLTVDAVVLIAHELASNAVRHGGGSGRLRLWQDDDTLYCEVSDAGPGLPDPASAGQTLPAPSLPGGRGLWIARQLSELHIVSSPGGTAITATLPL